LTDEPKRLASWLKLVLDGAAMDKGLPLLIKKVASKDFLREFMGNNKKANSDEIATAHCTCPRRPKSYPWDCCACSTCCYFLPRRRIKQMAPLQTRFCKVMYISGVSVKMASMSHGEARVSAKKCYPFQAFVP
jgi:hypothetical protein